MGSEVMTFEVLVGSTMVKPSALGVDACVKMSVTLLGAAVQFSDTSASTMSGVPAHSGWQGRTATEPVGEQAAPPSVTVKV
jgi:hypothetical protein